MLITRRGRPAAVIMSPEDLEALEETLDLLSTPGAVVAIREAEADIAAGKMVSGSELRSKYLKR